MSDISDAESSNRDGEGCSWYRSRRSIEENSPSRRDGIDLEKEIYLRASYSDFLQNLGMRLKVPQFTIATAIVFCHRFFLRQSHAKNDRWTIATACMFLAGKVEETQQPLEDVILASYGILHEKDPEAEQRINKREVLEQQEKLILLGERLVLKTLDYDLCVCHPYKPLVEAIKKFEVGEALVQVAWNFVNDGLRTSMCLQYEPYLIAAGAIFLAAKFLKVKLPSDGERKWWQELNVTTRQLEEVSNQILELYEQARRIAASNEVEGSEASGDADRMPEKATANNEEPASEQNVEVQLQENQPNETLHQEKMEEAQSASEVGLERSGEEGQEDNGKFNATEAEEEKDKQFVQSDSQKLGDGST